MYVGINSRNRSNLDLDPPQIFSLLIVHIDRDTACKDTEAWVHPILDNTPCYFGLVAEELRGPNNDPIYSTYQISIWMHRESCGG